jgi:hypothetical protein
MSFSNVLHLVLSTLSALIYEGRGSILRLTANITAGSNLVEMTEKGIILVNVVTAEPQPDIKMWGPRGNQNVEAPISNNKFRLRQFSFHSYFL